MIKNAKQLFKMNMKDAEDMFKKYRDEQKNTKSALKLQRSIIRKINTIDNVELKKWLQELVRKSKQ